jgi:hypothetical protein
VNVVKTCTVKALHAGREPRAPIGWKAGWTPGSIGTFAEELNLLRLWGTEHHLLVVQPVV